MSRIRLRVSGVNDGRQPPSPAQQRLTAPKVTLRGSSGRVFTFEVAPSSLEHTGLARGYDEFPRVGIKPLLVRGDKQLRRYSFTAVLVARDASGNIDALTPVVDQIADLRFLAASGERVQWVNFGRVESGFFRVTSLTLTVARRRPSDRAVTVAEASVELTEASDSLLKAGPVSGGAEQVAPAQEETAGAGGQSAAEDPPRTYTVKQGDTLYAIALRELGSGSRYPEIAAASDITNPNLIFPGQELVIPGG